MAGFASLRRTVGTTPRHAFVEFAMMQILMAGGAGAILEMERQDLVLSAGGPHFMTIGARHGSVRAGQRKTRLAMFGDCECGAVPIQNGMTILAFVSIRSGFKLSVMRIDVAVDAGLELHVPVACLTAGHIRLVALLAFDLNVKTRQRIAGLGVIELLCRLPIHVIMTLQAFVSELAFVHIFVAGYAILRQPEKGLRKILHFDERAFVGNHVRGQVTFLASNARMLSLQLVAR